MQEPSGHAGDDVTVIERAQGRFGELVVCDGAGTRSLWCGLRCQGSCFLETGAPGDAPRPGPVPAAAYALAWLPAAMADPEGHVLMAGLGCGAGICALLHHLPRLRVTVAEIDPEVTRLALAHFPLLERHRAAGRCRIVPADVLDLVRAAADERWSTALLDAYDVDERLHCPHELLAALRGRARELWLNVVDDVGGASVEAVCARMLAAGWTPMTLMPVHDAAEDDAFAGNIVVGTAPLRRDLLRGFAPFAEDPGAAAAGARRSFRLLERGAMSIAAAS